MKYRIRFESGRVLGPFEKKDLEKRVSEFELSGKEEIQEYPVGEWVLLIEHDEMKYLSHDVESDQTYILKLDELEDETDHVNNDGVAEITDRRSSSEHQEFQYDKSNVVESSGLTNVEEVEDNTEIEEDLDRTVVRKITDLEEDADKTKVNLDYKKYLAEEKEKQLAEEKRKKEEELLALEKEKKEAEEIIDYQNDKTQFLSLKDVEEELVLAEELELVEPKEKTRFEKKTPKKTTIKKEIPKKKNYTIFILIAIALGALFFFDDGDKKVGLGKIKIIPPKIEFPPRAVEENQERAKGFFKKGLSFERKQTYIDDLKAIAMYKKSLINQYDGNPAGARLLFLYADVLKNSQNPANDKNKIYNLVQYFEDKMYSNPEYSTAGAYFYYVVDKTNAALNILDRYKSIEGNKKTAKLFAVYLRALSRKGDLVEAEKIAKSLDSKKNKDLFTLISLYEFSQVKSETEATISYLKEATKRFPNSLYFLIEKAELFLEKEDLDQVKKILYRMNGLNVEGSRYFYGQYLKVKGFYHAQKGELKKATRELKKSLKLYPDSDLLNRLSQGEETDNKEINTLFRTSRANVLIKTSQEYLEKDDVDGAFKYAVQAAEASEDSVSAKLNLASIQIKKGYFDDALKEVKALFEQNRANPEVLYSLVNIYIEMYKFREANQHLDLVEIKSDERYASAKALLYLKKKDYNLANGWLSKAININKLSEKNIFELAKLRIFFHKYESAKSTLNKATNLDPYNVDYKLSYAKILYEVESARSAIGYLYDVLKTFKDNIKILSEIGIYYYRSGQIKNYENVKAKIKSLPGNALELNKFLLESAKLDGNLPEIVRKARLVILDSPGDLEARLYLAQILIEIKKYKEAKQQLEEIRKRFSSYPRLKYFYARLYVRAKKPKIALELGLQEVKENPNVVDGYLLVGDIYKEEKDLLKAREFYQRASQVDTNSVDATLGLAFVAFHRDQYDNALDLYQRAVSIDPNRAEIYRLLGDTYRKIGQGQIAVKNYKQYLELSPSSRYKRAIESFIRTVE